MFTMSKNWWSVKNFRLRLMNIFELTTFSLGRWSLLLTITEDILDICIFKGLTYARPIVWDGNRLSTAFFQSIKRLIYFEGTVVSFPLALAFELTSNLLTILGNENSITLLNLFGRVIDFLGYFYFWGSYVVFWSLSVRRLRDLGKSWKWVFVMVIPVVDLIPMFLWCTKTSLNEDISWINCYIGSFWDRTNLISLYWKRKKLLDMLLDFWPNLKLSFLFIP